MTRSDCMALYRLAVSLHLTGWHLTAARVLYSVNGMESAISYLRGCPSTVPEQASLFPTAA